MKKISSALLVLCFVLSVSISGFAQNTYANINVDSAYSMIQANMTNPDFIILDVRTSNEYVPDHLTNAVNLNYSDSNFKQNLNSINKNKKYLIHCHSGSRSGRAFKIMQELEFKEVYNMLGGISAWKNKLYPTTKDFAPVIMQVSKDSILDFGNVSIGISDTFDITITNYGNDSLKFTSITDLSSTDFITNFDTNNILTGFDDYTFQVVYKPTSYSHVSSPFSIQSNGGNLSFSLIGYSQGAGIETAISTSGIAIYPNPTYNVINIKTENSSQVDDISLYSLYGKKIKCIKNQYGNSINLESLNSGVYILKFRYSNKNFSRKIIKQ